MDDTIDHWDVWGRLDGRVVHYLVVGTLLALTDDMGRVNATRDLEGMGRLKARVASATMVKRRNAWNTCQLMTLFVPFERHPHA